MLYQYNKLKNVSALQVTHVFDTHLDFVVIPFDVLCYLHTSSLDKLIRLANIYANDLSNGTII